MESVALSNVQLDYLARQDPCLKPYYRGALPCDGLPTNASHQQSAYIVNTDEKSQPGKHWIALWTRDNVCEVMDSYGLPVEIYEAKPLEIWLKRWPTIVANGQSLQNVDSNSCGHYALFFLKAKARGYSMSDFLNQFSKHDYVMNDHTVGQMLKSLIVDETAWNHVCKLKCEQSNKRRLILCILVSHESMRKEVPNQKSLEYVGRGSLRQWKNQMDGTIVVAKFGCVSITSQDHSLLLRSVAGWFQTDEKKGHSFSRRHSRVERFDKMVS